MAKKEDYGKKGREGIYWVVFMQVVETGLQFGSSIILARILFPEDFGLMGLASIAIQFSRRLLNFGLTSVLVQLKEIKDDHYHTVFWMNTVFMTTIAAVVFFTAAWNAKFFEAPQLELILKVISFDFILKAFSSIPEAILRRNIRFKEISFARTLGKFTTLSSAIIMAFLGWGVWSLVLGELIGSWIQRSAVIRYALRFSDWRPKFRFKKWAVNDTFAFGLWLYVNSYINFAINKVDYGFIGKFLGVTSLGYYEKAFELMSFPRKQIVRKMNTVAFSTYSRLQDDTQRLIRGLLQVTSYLSLFSYPLMIWLYFVAPFLIILLYGEKWAMTILPLQIMCVSGVLDSFTLIFQPLHKAAGFIGNSTRRDIFYLVILTGGVLLGIFYYGSIAGVALGVVFASIARLMLMINLTVQKFPFTLWAFIRAQRSALVYGSIQTGLLVLLVYGAAPYVGDNNLVMCVLISAVSAVGFFGSHFIIRFQDINDIMDEILKDFRKVARKVPVLNRIGFLTNSK